MNLNRITFNEDLTVKTKTEQPIRAYAQQANTIEVLAPVSGFNTAYIVLQGLANSVVNPRLRATQRLFMSPLAADGIYSRWNMIIPGAILNDMSLMNSTGVRVRVEFWYIEGDCLGVEKYNVEEGIEALLAADYPDATDGQFVRVIDTNTDWYYDAATSTWIDYESQYQVGVSVQPTSSVDFSLEKGIYSEAPSHLPTNTELILQELAAKLAKAGGTMTGDIDMDNNDLLNAGSVTLYNVGGNAVLTFDGTDLILNRNSVDEEVMTVLNKIGDLANVIETNLATDDILIYNGTNYVNITKTAFLAALSTRVDNADAAILLRELISNKVTDIGSTSTDTEYPSAKASYKAIKDLFKDVSYAAATGILTFTRFDDTTVTVDLPLELIIESGYYDAVNNDIVLVLANASEIKIPAGDLLTDLDAVNVRYNNTDSGLAATNTKAAIDELEANKAIDFSTVNDTKYPTTKAVENRIDFKTYEIQKLSKIKNKLVNPMTSFGGIEIDIFKKANGEYYTNFDANIEKYVGAGKTYYVAPITGLDSNDGLSRETPLKTFKVAYDKADVDIIQIIESAWIDGDKGFSNANTTKNLSIIADSGLDVYITTSRTVNFVKTAGYNNVYQFTRTQLLGVVDISEELNGGIHKLVSSISEVDNEPGTYFYQDDIVYVHTYNSRPADTLVKLFINTKNLFINGYYHIYLENIKLYGGNSYFVVYATSTYDGTQKTKFIAKNCEFKYTFETTPRSVVRLQNCISVLQNCIVKYATGDNIAHDNYCQSIEVSVTSENAGRNNGNHNQYNASSGHSNSKIIRLNGLYSNSEGPVIHDINSGTESWNINLDVHDSKTLTDNRNTNYRAEDGSKLWLDGCIGYNSLINLDVASISSSIYIRNSYFDDGQFLETGTIENY